MQISRTRHKGENNNGKWRLGMQIDLMKRQGLGRSLFLLLYRRLTPSGPAAPQV